jgi:hypothetical protein
MNSGVVLITFHAPTIATHYGVIGHLKVLKATCGVGNQNQSFTDVRKSRQIAPVFSAIENAPVHG